ncbi:CoA pyrophosphatase [soil metagenome]
MARLSFDPEAAPVVASEPLPALPAAGLTAERLRLAFRQPLDWTPEAPELPEAAVAALERPLASAAVLVPLVRRPGGLSVLLTRRTAHLNDHAGQISFPGGRAEAFDASVIETALRETREEVGIDAGEVEVVGRLHDYVTRTGYRVTPVVGLLDPPRDLRPDPFEVAEVFETPLSFLMDPANHETRALTRFEGAIEVQRRFFAMHWRAGAGDYFIWGATAGMLRDLYRCLAARGFAVPQS